MSKTKLLKARLEGIEYEMKQILRLLKNSGIKCDTFCAGFSPIQGSYIGLPGNSVASFMDFFNGQMEIMTPGHWQL